MSSIVNLRTGLGPVLSLFGAKDRWTSPLIKARTVPTLQMSCYSYVEISPDIFLPLLTRAG